MFGAVPPDPAYDAYLAATSAVAPQPLLYLHGDRDGCMDVAMAAGAPPFMSPASKVQIVPGTGHFFHVEKPAEVNRLIVDWVRAG